VYCYPMIPKQPDLKGEIELLNCDDRLGAIVQKYRASQISSPRLFAPIKAKPPCPTT